MKVMTILGTRPEIIRLSEVVRLLESTDGIDHILVHTGQNYDYELNEVFFKELEIRQPDHLMAAAGKSFGETCGNLIKGAERVLLEHRPDAVLILGDTDSALSAIVAKRLHIPIYHMEAGNRCFDFNVPEEINRRIVDHIADFNLVYTEHARRHLLAEGLPHRRIHLTGSPMREVLERHRNSIEKSDVLRRLSLEPRRYLTVSIHRQENVESSRNLDEILAAIGTLAGQLDMPVIMSAHPRTRARIEERKLTDGLDKHITLAKPFGFFDYNRLQKSAYCVLSDSGTISEEASILGFPAVTVRNAMERPEAIDTGSIALTGIDRANIILTAKTVASAWESGVRPDIPADYRITDTSQRVVRLIMGTAGLSNRWAAIEAAETD